MIELPPWRCGPVLAGVLALAVGGGACQRAPLPVTHGADSGVAGGGPGGNSGLAGGAAGGTLGGPTDGAVVAGSDAGDQPTPGLDPGRVAIHRLNHLEYDNTVHDLLGVDGHARAIFQSDERGEFDNDAEAFTMNDARYEQYFDAATDLTDATFAATALRARIVTCAPASATDATCATEIIRAFGARAWRRPLTDTEVETLATLVSDALGEGRTFDEAIKRVVRALLSSVPFLYRLEFDVDPTSLAVHPLSNYELAARLSYWLWSTMPDARLFELAASGTLFHADVLGSEIDRLLADARSDVFVDSFAGQWLGARDLQSRQVEPTLYPDFDETLRAAMLQEAHDYFSEFLHTDLKWPAFLTADFNFVNARLARHYGLPTQGLGDAMVRIENTTDARKGYLGLAGTLTSVVGYSEHVTPMYRGKWILEQLLCTPPPGGDANDGTLASFPQETPRQFVERLLAAPACGGCHKFMDPVGLTLEEFDRIGRFRTTYADGTPIDSSGALPDGRKVSGEAQLSDLLAQDPRLLDCATHKALTYALGRGLGDADQPHLTNIVGAWNRQGLTLRALIKQIVVNDTFRFRRGEANP
jgi:hypothetical protein